MKGSIKLANGETFSGNWHGEMQEGYGELIHYTGMGNFQAFLTDPAIKGKIVLSTYPGVLNSMITEKDFESSAIQAAGIITQQEWPLEANGQQMAQYCLKHDVPVLTGADTRAIMKRLRHGGEMPAQMAVNSEDRKLVKAKSKGKKLSFLNNVIHPSGKKHLLVLNFGLKQSLIDAFTAADVKLTIASPHISLDEVETIHPDGIVFSGGPGSPLDWKDHFPVYEQLAKTYPTIGFGLGHQMLAVMFGAKIEKMKRGHRSFKQPVVHITSNQVYLSKQNHGYEIDEKSLGQTGFQASYKSVQDGAIEGLIHRNYSIQTFQFHPNGTHTKLENEMFRSIFKQLEQVKGARIYA